MNMYIGMGLVTLITLSLSSILLPQTMVLGNNRIPSFLALVLNSVLLTVLLVLVPIISKKFRLKLKSATSMNFTYGTVNIVGLWVLSKLANIFGFGIASFWVAIMLGSFITIVQFFLWNFLSKRK